MAQAKPKSDNSIHTTIVEITRIYVGPVGTDGLIPLEFHGIHDGNVDHEQMFVNAGIDSVYLMNDQGTTIDTIC